MFTPEYFMKQALQEAEIAREKDEVPIGCVIVFKDRIIARGHNLTEQLNDVTAHAEMQAITSAANFLGGKYLKDCTLYVTLEPCVMCAGALTWSQISKVVIGARDEKVEGTEKEFNDLALLAFLMTTGKWESAFQRGTNVKSKFVLPVKFVVEE